jgi:hypothetical protein
MKLHFEKTPIIQALLWAAAILGSAILLKGSEQKENVFFLLLMVSTVSVLTLSGKRSKRCCKDGAQAE